MDGRFRQIISGALELNINELGEDLALDPQGNWDSVSLLSTISEIDTQYGIQLDGLKLERCRKISEIYALIKHHQK